MFFSIFIHILKGGKMKYYFKIFLTSFVSFSILFCIILFLTNDTPVHMDNKAAEILLDGNPSIAHISTLLKKQSRINILVMGTDGERTDTILVLTYDTKNQLADLISIPRDTYNYVEGKNASQKKINAVYDFKGSSGGANGLKYEISKILDIEINYYVKLDYNAVSKIVDTVGGIDINIPWDMDYDDNYSKPPLHIHFKSGIQNLKGDDVLNYLRWRSNNDGSYSNGDLDRITRQQDFIKSLAKKTLTIKLPLVVKDSFTYIETDMTLNELLFLATHCLQFQLNNLNTYTLPGKPEVKNMTSYFIHNHEKTKELINKIYLRHLDKLNSPNKK